MLFVYQTRNVGLRCASATRQIIEKAGTVCTRCLSSVQCHKILQLIISCRFKAAAKPVCEKVPTNKGIFLAPAAASATLAGCRTGCTSRALHPPCSYSGGSCTKCGLGRISAQPTLIQPCPPQLNAAKLSQAELSLAQPRQAEPSQAQLPSPTLHCIEGQVSGQGGASGSRPGTRPQTAPPLAYSTVQYSTAQYSTVQWTALQCSAGWRGCLELLIIIIFTTRISGPIGPLF